MGRMMVRDGGSLDDQVDTQMTGLLLMLTSSWNVSSYSCQLFQLSLRQSTAPAKSRLLRSSFEKVVLECVVRGYSGLWVILQHSQD